MSPRAHIYLSTACQHALAEQYTQRGVVDGLHMQCRLTCKFCHAPCVCLCHEEPVTVSDQGMATNPA